MDVFSVLQSICRDVFADPQLCITRDTKAGDVRGWDSLAHIRLIVAVEKHFRIRMKNAEISRLRNVGDLEALVVKYCPDLSKREAA
jgi:acyl carrier protein